MANGRLGIELEKVTVNLFKGDFRAAGELFPENHASHTLRTVLRRVIKAEALRQGKHFPHIEESEKAKEVEF